MKSKLGLLALTGVLALAASAPNAMASSVSNHANPRPNAVTRPAARSFVKKSVTKRTAPANARSSHATK